MSHAFSYLQRKTRSGREFTGARTHPSSTRSHAVIASSSQFEEGPLVLNAPERPLPIALPPRFEEEPPILSTPELPLSKRSLSPPPAAAADVLITKKRRHGPKRKGPHKESRQSTTNNGTHRRRRAHTADQNVGGHRCTPEECQAVVASSQPYHADTFHYSGTGGRPGNYHGTHLGAKTTTFPHLHVEELELHDYAVVPWDGKAPKPILDSEGRVFAVFAGQPEDEGYQQSCRELFMELERLGEGYIPKKHDKRTRGSYLALDCGVTHGPGSQTISNTVPRSSPEDYQRVLDSKPVRRLCGFCDGAFNRWAPELYERYRDVLNLATSPPYSHINKISGKSVFASHCLNTGSSVATTPHRDSMNLANGWCAVVALGDFDDCTAGHLVLHEPRLAIQFPAGSAALIPSTAITHSNAKLKAGDKRASITFYTGGGLFRFIDNNFRTLSSMSPQEQEEMRVACEAGGTSESILFSTFDELRGVLHV